MRQRGARRLRRNYTAARSRPSRTSRNRTDLPVGQFASMAQTKCNAATPGTLASRTSEYLKSASLKLLTVFKSISPAASKIESSPTATTRHNKLSISSCSDLVNSTRHSDSCQPRNWSSASVNSRFMIFLEIVRIFGLEQAVFLESVLYPKLRGPLQSRFHRGTQHQCRRTSQKGSSCPLMQRSEGTDQAYVARCGGDELR